MKKIELHKIDEPEVINWNFNRRQKHLPNYIIDAKETFRFLFYVYRDSSELLQMSVAEKPELPIQKHWFTYGLNCISEYCKLVHYPNEEKESQIDDSGNFIIKIDDIHELEGIKKPIQLARIARDKEKEKIIASFPSELLNLDRNLTFNHTYVNILTKLEIEYSLTGNFNKDYYANLIEIYEKNSHNIQAKISSGYNNTLFYIHPYVVAFNSLTENNEIEFNQNLIKALEAHKEVWCQKKALNKGGTPLCRENEGFLSWDCTALAAMAYDKGWKLEVETDYMPSFMVVGSINKLQNE